MKRETLCRVFAATLCAALLCSVLLPLKSGAEVYETVVRVHVVAHSNSEKDQQIKLAVREELLDLTQDALTGFTTAEQVQSYLFAKQDWLSARLCNFLRGIGVFYDARLMWEREYHDEKSYEDICLPAGEYKTLRVVLGEGAGENFFCVLFPPLCRNSSGMSASEVLLDYGFSEGQMRLLVPSGERVVRLSILQWFRDLMKA